MEKRILDFNVLIERSEDGIYIASVPELQGCYTQGKNVSQVLERIKEAIEVCIDSEYEYTVPLQFVSVQKVSISV